MPVLEACKIDGKMTAIPMSFSFPAVMFSQRLMEEVGIDLTGVKAVSSTQLLDWYDQARESKPDLTCSSLRRERTLSFPPKRLITSMFPRQPAPFSPRNLWTFWSGQTAWETTSPT